MRRLIILVFFFSSVYLQAEFDPSSCLGLDLPSVLETCGPPLEVFPLRGDEPWQDDVVFRYSTGYSLFLFRDRVWQVRVWEAGILAGVHPGDTLEAVQALYGDPMGDREGSYIFNLPDNGFPIRLRVLTDQGIITDLYLYRADF